MKADRSGRLFVFLEVTGRVKKLLAIAPVVLAAGLATAALSPQESGPPSVRADQPDEPAPTPITTEITPARAAA